MRIWHKQLLPKLCRQHLLASWREGLGIYSIITNHKHGYHNHPQVKAYTNCPQQLKIDLELIQTEMITRGYKPKKLDWQDKPSFLTTTGERHYKPWQTLIQQTNRLREKRCMCTI